MRLKALLKPKRRRCLLKQSLLIGIGHRSFQVSSAVTYRHMATAVATGTNRSAMYLRHNICKTSIGFNYGEASNVGKYTVLPAQFRWLRIQHSTWLQVDTR